MLCEKCGSTEVVRSRSHVIDKVIRYFTGRKPFVCRRCGWRGRRLSNQQARHALASSDSDPGITVLDQSQHGTAVGDS